MADLIGMQVVISQSPHVAHILESVNKVRLNNIQLHNILEQKKSNMRTKSIPNVKARSRISNYSLEQWERKNLSGLNINFHS